MDRPQASVPPAPVAAVSLERDSSPEFGAYKRLYRRVGDWWSWSTELDHPRAVVVYSSCRFRLFREGASTAPDPEDVLLW